VEQEALVARGLTEDDMCVPVQVMPRAEIGRLMAEQDVVLSF
jgi:tRNA 2-thiouridine synthesizing protein C